MAHTPSEKRINRRKHERGQRVATTRAPRIFAVAVLGTGRGGKSTRPTDARVILASVLFTITAPGRRPLMPLLGTPVGLAVPCPGGDYRWDKLRMQWLRPFMSLPVEHPLCDFKGCWRVLHLRENFA